MTSLLKPILLLGSGRTGSTLAMSILATSEDVVFRKEYPFETRLLTYAYHMANTITKPTKDIPNWSHGTLNQNDLDLVGPIPFPIKDYIKPDLLRQDFFKALWGTIGDRMRAAEKRPNATLYAEKAPNFIRNSIESFTELSCIHLVRDPRDIFLSIKSFNKKRGTLRFGWLESDTEESYAIRMARRYDRVLTAVHKDKIEKRSLIVRYEDLIDKQDETIRSMSEWVGTEFKAPPKSPDFLKKHSTSQSTKGSVARWKTELSPEIASIFSKNMPKALEKFDYEV